MSLSDSEMVEFLELGNESIQFDVPHFQVDLTIDDVFGTGPGGLPAAGLPASVGLSAAPGLLAAAGLPAAAGFPAAAGLSAAAAGLPANEGLPAAGLPAGVDPGPEVLVVHQKRKPYWANGKLKKPNFAKETIDKLEEVYLSHGPNVPLQQRRAIEKDMGMTKTQIKNWFNHRKNKKDD